MRTPTGPKSEAGLQQKHSLPWTCLQGHPHLGSLHTPRSSPGECMGRGRGEQERRGRGFPSAPHSRSSIPDPGRKCSLLFCCPSNRTTAGPASAPVSCARPRPCPLVAPRSTSETPRNVSPLAQERLLALGSLPTCMTSHSATSCRTTIPRHPANQQQAVLAITKRPRCVAAHDLAQWRRRRTSSSSRPPPSLSSTKSTRVDPNVCCRSTLRYDGCGDIRLAEDGYVDVSVCVWGGEGVGGVWGSGPRSWPVQTVSWGRLVQAHLLLHKPGVGLTSSTLHLYASAAPAPAPTPRTRPHSPNRTPLPTPQQLSAAHRA
jgi:hypothetical protein